MKIILFANPDFFGGQNRPGFSSMPRFTNMIAEGMKQRGHDVSIWQPKSKFSLLKTPRVLKKWLGYIDQYVVFPTNIGKFVKDCDEDTLFVFTDQAQGPWVPLVANRCHLIHCHDFLAQASAQGKIPENKTGLSGRIYQKFILDGLSKGKKFIAVSHKTRADLHQLLLNRQISSTVIYNGLDPIYKPVDLLHARNILAKETNLYLGDGFLLHVGNNQWYKNRTGVIEIYNSWRDKYEHKLPLLLIGDKPSDELIAVYNRSVYKNDIYVLNGLSDEMVNFAYASASVFIFPSLAEGFGWPIAEAMACGCPVVTTGEAPMTEVAGDAAFYIPRRPAQPQLMKSWAIESAKVISHVIGLTHAERDWVVQAGIANAARFNLEKSLNDIENVYLSAINRHVSTAAL